MSVPLSWAIDADDGRFVVRVRGTLDLTSASRLRVALLKCLAEQPEALLVDISAMRVAARTALSVFTAVVRQAAMWPGTPVVLCAPTAESALLFSRGRYGRLPVAPSVAAGEAVLSDARRAIPSISDHLPPIPGASRHARGLVTEACARWELPHLVGPACVVISELVTNAVQHAGTTMTVRLALRGRHLHIAVRDGSVAQPMLLRPAVTDPTGGRGLQLVASTAAHWGVLPSDDGKVVWAALAIDSS
jgi:anti-anti-sigma regulatory factor